MSIKQSKTEDKYNNLPDIPGFAPDGRKYKYTDNYRPEFSRIDREARGLPEKIPREDENVACSMP